MMYDYIEFINAKRAFETAWQTDFPGCLYSPEYDRFVKAQLNFVTAFTNDGDAEVEVKVGYLEELRAIVLYVMDMNEFKSFLKDHDHYDSVDFEPWSNQPVTKS